MHEYERKLLSLLSETGREEIVSIARATGMERDQVMWAAESLAARGAVIISKNKIEEAVLMDEGMKYLDRFPEEGVIREVAGKKTGLGRALGNITEKKMRDGGRYIAKNKPPLSQPPHLIPI